MTVPGSRCRYKGRALWLIRTRSPLRRVAIKRAPHPRGGESGGVKSNVVHMLVAAAALDPYDHPTLFDGKTVELAEWRGCAAASSRPACRTPSRRSTSCGPTWSAATPTCSARAVGIIVVSATQKPSSDIVPTALRDLFGFRWSLRCLMPQASDTILGSGWASLGFSALVDPCQGLGLGLLLDEGGEVRLRSYYLADKDLAALAFRAASCRRLFVPAPPPRDSTAGAADA